MERPDFKMNKLPTISSLATFEKDLRFYFEENNIVFKTFEADDLIFLMNYLRQGDLSSCGRFRVLLNFQDHSFQGPYRVFNTIFEVFKNGRSAGIFCVPEVVESLYKKRTNLWSRESLICCEMIEKGAVMENNKDIENLLKNILSKLDSKPQVSEESFSIKHQVEQVAKEALLRNGVSILHDMIIAKAPEHKSLLEMAIAASSILARKFIKKPSITQSLNETAIKSVQELEISLAQKAKELIDDYISNNSKKP